MENKVLAWEIDSFENLNLNNLYEIVYLRSKIFVVEQNCPYQDVDFKDQKAIHLQGYYDNKLVAYCRLFKAGDYFEESSIGRVVVAEEYRKYGFGHQLIDKAIELMKTQLEESTITISAQLYLKKFYESHGFRQVSEVYLEDDIPHTRMEYTSL